jgi:predicted AlkP superfamily phosphohydrolase/phosphomutase
MSKQTSPPRRTLVIGLDGATFDLIKPWVAEGRLPALSHLLEQGAHTLLESTIPPMTAPAWTSFATGTNPGQHRLYDWIARESDSYRFSPITALDATAPTLYTLLSQANRRVCALNIPMTYPPQPVNGVMVAGMPAPDIHGLTYPEGLYEQILDQVGDYILYPDPGQAYSDTGVEAFLERLYRCTKLRIKTFDYLRQQDNWDFAMMVFNGTDTISHALWKYMDENHPLHDDRLSAKFGNAIRDYYEYVDAYLSKVIETLDNDTTLVLMSDHGFGPFHKFIHVNNWLIQEGFMRLRPGLGPNLKKRLFDLGFAPMNVYDKLVRLGFGALKRKVVRGQGQGLLKTLFLSFEDVDWSRTTAYSLGNVGQIYINLAGREPEGKVQAGVDYIRLRGDIMQRLAQLRDPVTAELVVETIYRREEIYSGDQLEHAPDIVFMPRRLEYFGFGEYEFGSNQIIEPMKRGISGTHRMNGIFLAYGDNIRPGITLEKAHLTDLAPTILYMMGLQPPAHMDGRVLREIFHNSFQPALDQLPNKPQNDFTNNGQGLTEEEKEIVSERLRDLGYVG